MQSLCSKSSVAKENTFDDDNDIEYDEKPMLALSDSEADEIEKDLTNVNPRDESKGYRYSLDFIQYECVKQDFSVAMTASYLLVSSKRWIRHYMIKEIFMRVRNTGKNIIVILKNEHCN